MKVCGSGFLIYLAYKLKNKKRFLIFVLIATILQTIPLKIAYYDENNLNHSTRLSSAKWINDNIIEKNKTICKKDFSPFDFPPVNFNKIKIEYLKERNEGHYESSPYIFKPRIAKKFIGKNEIELGQGLLDLIYEVHSNIK